MAATVEQPGQLFNWNLTEASSPAVVVGVSNIGDVQRVIRNQAAFPSPVLAVGAMHSVNACITNTGGTLLNTSAMDKVLGLEPQGLRVQAGCKMADIYDWLAQHDLETSFCPEIGDATVGSLVVTTSKDSSIEGPGYLSAIVAEVTYVDENGLLVTLSKSKQPAELAAFTCSYGMMGVVVEAVLEVRPRTPIITRGFTVTAKTGAAAVKAVTEARAKHDALFAILVPDRDYVYLEAREKAGASAVFARNRALGAVVTVGENEIVRQVMVATKYKCFLKGQPPGRKTASIIFSNNPFPLVHYRNLFTNRYPEIQPGTRRLDFSYLEFNLPTFEAVLTGCWDFHKQFKAQHGFAPRGYGVYFVTRGYTSDGSSSSSSSSSTPATTTTSKGAAAAAAAAGTGAGAASASAAGAGAGAGAAPAKPSVDVTAAAAAGKTPDGVRADIVGRIVGVRKQQQQQGGKVSAAGQGVLVKPYGNYSQWGPGVSFMMDPITDDADSPLWISFNEAYTAWAVSMGAIPSLSQTKGLKPGQVTLPRHLTRERFLTPYYQAFVA